ncbi:MAG: DUF427 domain-containing protein [Caulobacteraceae bacterium]|nr:DUF427 domain-containing protein [Caulobacteraceae bacterium]
MKIPDQDHPIEITTAPRRVRVRHVHHVIADSDDVLVLREANLAPVYYFPRADIEMGYFSRTDRMTHCPYKGDASYFTILVHGEFAENAAWSYEEPFPAMEAITGRIAFYPHKVEIYEVDASVEHGGSRDRPSGRRNIDEIVQHTDAGDGTTQKPHWAPNVRGPEA